MLVFSHAFPVLWKSTFPMFWELYGFLLHPKYLRNPEIWNGYVFPCFSSAMEIHFSHVLGIVWISTSPRILKKPINFKCLCFPMLFPYYGNPLLPCFGNCMDFYFNQNIKETHKFEMSVFSQAFPALWKSTFPMFWKLCGFLLHPRY